MPGRSSASDRPEDGAEGGLPATAYAVLGVLANLDEELSAAEIKTRCDYSLKLFYWSPAVSHIRRELRRLRELELVTEREVEIGKVRRSLVYQTTERGERVLAAWVSRHPVDEPVVLKNPALLRVYLGASSEPYELVKVLDHRLAELQEQIDDLVWGRRRKDELGLLGAEEMRYQEAVTEYLLRAAHFEYGNVRQLRDRIADFAPDQPSLAVHRRKGPLRRRRHMRPREDNSGE
ncbi:hypothetical protein [Actinomadura sp. 9N407]|uniref:hypothetical protein n=1 Tax=Actinomadura sp. 9N407 TaxID=3375154 RepID=UPI0037922F43